MRKSTTLFGQKIGRYAFEEVVEEIISASEKKHQSFFFAVNVNILLLLHRNPTLRKKYQQAKIIYPDGVPLLWLSRVFSKKPLVERVSGTDLVERLLKESKKDIFLVGSTPEILKEVQKNSPTVVGRYSPPYLAVWPKKITQEIVKKINASKAKIVLMAAGTPKQEKWLLDHLPKTTAAVGIGVGSAFDILSGKNPRAPRFMRSYGLEWMWRIFLEPGRLLGRYLKDALGLLRVIIQEL